MGALWSRIKGEPQDKTPQDSQPHGPPTESPGAAVHKDQKDESPGISPESKAKDESSAPDTKVSPVASETGGGGGGEIDEAPVESKDSVSPGVSPPSDGGVDPAAQGAQSEDRFYNNKSFQKPDIDPSDSQQQDAALKIQTKYRQHHAKQEVQKKREEKAATTIQATYRGHTDRQKVKDIKEGEAAEEAAEEEKVEEPAEESKPEEEVDIDLADPDVQAAATKIQASFRGHKARQEVKELKEHAQPAEEAPATEEPKEEESTDKEVVDIDLNDPQVAAAATKIQAGVRGYMARKEVHKMKGTTEESQEVTSQEITSQEVTSAEAEEEVDIDLEDPEVAAAAAKIQAKFRGLQLRKGFGRKKDDKPEVTEAVPSKQEVTLPKPESSLEEESQSKKEEEEEIDIDLEDPEVAAAAAKIQAKFRGHKLKKTFGKKEDKQEVSEEVPSLGVTSQEVTSQEVTSQNGTRDMARQEEEEIDIDLDDPEVAAAAAKIQAKFRGHMSKKGFGRRKEPNTEETQEVTSQDEKQEVTSQDEKQEVTSQDDKQEVTVQEDKQEVTSAEQETTSVEDEGTADVKGEEVKDSTTEETPQEVKAEGEDEGKEPEEEVDIDLNDPDVQAAATKIQAGFRGHMTRKEMTKQKEEQGEAAPAEGQEAEGQEGEATDINLEDPEVIAAATKIQAAVRGHHARQEVQVMKDSLEEAVAESQEIPPAEKEEEVDVDLNDPAVNQAATKIQAGFRGYKARQEVQTLKDSKSPEGGAAEAPPEVTSEAPAAPEGNQPEAADEDKKEEVDIDLNDPEVAQAATKIQAAFKGHLVRKDMKDKEGKEETTGDAPADGEVTENKEGDQGEV